MVGLFRLYVYRTIHEIARAFIILELRERAGIFYWLGVVMVLVFEVPVSIYLNDLLQNVLDPNDSWTPSSSLFFFPLIQSRGLAQTYLTCGILARLCEYLDVREYLNGRKGGTLWKMARYMGLAFNALTTSIFVTRSDYYVVLLATVAVSSTLKLLATRSWIKKYKTD